MQPHQEEAGSYFLFPFEGRVAGLAAQKNSSSFGENCSKFTDGGTFSFYLCPSYVASIALFAFVPVGAHGRAIAPCCSVRTSFLTSFMSMKSPQMRTSVW